MGKYLALFWPVTLTWLRYNFYGVSESEEEYPSDDMMAEEEEPAEPVEPVAAEEEAPAAEEEAPAEDEADDVEVDDY